MISKIIVEHNQAMQKGVGYISSGILASISILGDFKEVLEVGLLFASTMGVMLNTYYNIRNKKKK